MSRGKREPYTEDEKKFMERVGHTLALKRFEKNRSMTDVCNTIGIAVYSLGKYEMGKIAPTIVTLRKICKELDIDMTDILEE